VGVAERLPWRFSLAPIGSTPQGAYNSSVNGHSYKRTGKLGIFLANRRVTGLTRHKRQVVLAGYSLDRDQARHLETYLREHSIEAFVCPSVEDETCFSVAVWLKDQPRALAVVARGPIPPVL
jgi:hypothetical protein